MKGDLDALYSGLWPSALAQIPNNFWLSTIGLAYAGGKENFDVQSKTTIQAILLNPNAALTFYNRGSALAAEGEVDHAIEDYDRAIGLNSNFSQAFLNRGFAYAVKGDF